MFAVNEHILFDLIVMDYLSITKVRAHKTVKISWKFICIEFIFLSKFEGLKGGWPLGKIVIFNNIVAMNFGQNIVSIAASKF